VNKILLSLTFLFVFTAEASFTTEKCPSFDNRKNFGAVRDQDGKCQAYVRNSWGKGSVISEWQDIQPILEETYKIEHLEQY
jgi:hypothetical protein